MSFFRRLSNRLHTHPSRRFGRYRGGTAHTSLRTDTVDMASAGERGELLPPSNAGLRRRHNAALSTSSASTSSSVRRATLAATRAAAAATGPPPPSILPFDSQFMNAAMQPPSSSNTSSSAASTTSAVSNRSDLSHMLSEIITTAILSSLNSTSSNTRDNDSQQQNDQRSDNTSFRYYIQVPIRGGNHDHGDEARFLPIVVIGYRSSSSSSGESPTGMPLHPPPHPPFSFHSRPRPRSTVSTSSSLATLQSMPLSVHSNRTAAQAQQAAPPPPPPPPSSNAAPPQQDTTGNNDGGQWMIYVLSGQGMSPVLSDNPSYDDLLWLSNIIGPARPVTTTQAAIDAVTPVIPWSDDTKHRAKGTERCLVCLDDFIPKQSVRVLKCSHVFHQECVDRWLCETHNSCPVCRGIPVDG
ncbi:hypothetical protein K492DRAFT_173544 [Lichtheimia hyalospora FSU 10163]|nr:hypothetical protein K492DRAFT_173544 [Lichtheimia hyalospora FSU 10163]